MKYHFITCKLSVTILFLVIISLNVTPEFTNKAEIEYESSVIKCVIRKALGPGLYQISV